MATRYRVTTFDSRVSSLFDPGEPVQEFAKEVNQEALRLAHVYVPKRSRTLDLGHRNGGVLKVGRYHARGNVYNTAPYAKYVHEGTIGPIIPLHSFALTVPRAVGGLPVRHGGRNIMLVGPAFRKKSVGGQEANPWLELAGTQAALRVYASRRVRVG